MIVLNLIVVYIVQLLLISNYSEGAGKGNSMSQRSSGSKSHLNFHGWRKDYKGWSASSTRKRHRQFVHNEKIDKELDKALAEAHTQRTKINKQIEISKSHRLYEQRNVPYGTGDRDKHLYHLHAQNKELETAKSLNKASFVFQKQHPPLSQALHREAEKHRKQHETYKAIYDVGIKTRNMRFELIPSQYDQDLKSRNQLRLEKHKTLDPVWNVLEGNEKYFDRKFNHERRKASGPTFKPQPYGPITEFEFLRESEQKQEKWAKVLKDHKDLYTSPPLSEKALAYNQSMQSSQSDRKRKQRE